MRKQKRICALAKRKSRPKPLEADRLFEAAAGLEIEVEPTLLTIEPETLENSEDLSQIEISAEAESLRPLETWQFAVEDEVELLITDVAVLEPAAVVPELEQAVIESPLSPAVQVF